MGVGSGADLRFQGRQEVGWGAARLTPEQRRQAFARNRGGLAFREPCLTQEILKFSERWQLAMLDDRLHCGDHRTLIHRNGDQAHLVKSQLNQLACLAHQLFADRAVANRQAANRAVAHQPMGFTADLR